MHLSGICLKRAQTVRVNVDGLILNGGFSARSIVGGYVTEVALSDGVTLDQIWDFNVPIDPVGVLQPTVGPYVLTLYDREFCPSPACDQRGPLAGAGTAVALPPTNSGGVKTWRVFAVFALTGPLTNLSP